MNPHVSAITLGVRDLPRARQFYGEGLGWPVEQDYPQWVSFKMGEGSSVVGLYPQEALAGDAGVSDDPGLPGDGTGFPGVTLSYIVRTEERVAEVLAEAERAGATVLKPAEHSQWGGASGFFADPDGFVWKVASGGGGAPFSE
jgi:catechol 2,3-dioxygenase-like lactoylglutathione lyase family enzyme